jgi:hypothetical protein
MVVITDITFTWDGAKQRLNRGTVLDIPAGQAILSVTATNVYGTPAPAALSTFLTALTAQQQVNGSSDSISVASLENQGIGAGGDPYNAGQAG